MNTRGVREAKSEAKCLQYTYGKAAPQLERSSHPSNTKKQIPKPPHVEIISNNEDTSERGEIQKPKPKLTPAVVVGEYLLNAKTIVSVQAVYRDCCSLVEGLFIYSRYIAES